MIKRFIAWLRGSRRPQTTEAQMEALRRALKKRLEEHREGKDG